MTTVAVQTFVIEPIWNSESVVASTPVAMLRMPEAAVAIPSSVKTATDAPGTSCLARRTSSRSCRIWSSIGTRVLLQQFGAVTGEKGVDATGDRRYDVEVVVV